MIEKIKKHFSNLNNTQKVVYLILVSFIVFGEPLLRELGVSSRRTGSIQFGIIMVSVLGIFLFKDKSEEN
tara:strand:+ start:340 stop:549 length:210 start_codon:yes stop_codon:yes gene_type:complete